MTFNFTLIGDGSVVTKNVEQGTMVYGNPAKEIRKRSKIARVARRLCNVIRS